MYIGIDVHKDVSNVAVMDDTGEYVQEDRVCPSTPGNGSSSMTSAATSFTSDAERYPSGSGIL
jgi:hypothetical protein